MEVIMRRAKQSDVTAIHEICNQAVEDGSFRLEIDRKDTACRERWLLERGKRHPVYVGEVEGAVVCWIALDRYSSRYPFDCVADLSLFVRRDMHNKGLEALLLKFIEQRAVELGYYKIMFEVAGADQSALHAYRGAGYRDVGILRRHGYYQGRLVDVIIMERLLLPNLDFLQQYYSKKYPFYQAYFAAQTKPQPDPDGFRFGAHEAEERHEEPPADPGADPISQLPEGIVRFLKSKKPLSWQKPQEPQEPEDPLEEPQALAGELPDPQPEPAPVSAAGAEPAGEPEYEEDPNAPAELPEGIVRFLKAKPNPPQHDPAAQPATAVPEPPAASGPEPDAEQPELPQPAKKSKKKRSRKSKTQDPDAPLEGQLQFEDILPDDGVKPTE